MHDTELLEVVGEFDNPLKATEIFMKGNIDLVFLDIQMPKITGIDFLKSLHQPPLVIITTAYPQYAVEGFDLNVVDYLLKPFSFDRFLKAIMKAKLLLSPHSKVNAEGVTTSGEYFFIKADNSLLKIRLDEILFIEALQNYIAIHTAAKKHISYLTFRMLEESLPGDLFLKVHKSYMVSISKINSINGNEILIGNHRVPISRSMKDEVMEKILRGRFFRR
jgi:DNA-binding LytR/AlgR family response regulator